MHGETSQRNGGFTHTNILAAEHFFYKMKKLNYFISKKSDCHVLLKLKAKSFEDKGELQYIYYQFQ